MYIPSYLTLKNINSKRKFRANHQTSQQGQSTSVITGLTVTMFSVCTVFTVTTLPGRVIFMFYTIAEYLGIDDVHYEKYLVIGNHCVNFLLYCMTGSVLRQTFASLFKKCKVRQPPRPIEEQIPTVES